MGLRVFYDLQKVVMPTRNDNLESIPSSEKDCSDGNMKEVSIQASLAAFLVLLF